MPSRRRAPRSKGSEGSIWRRTVLFVVSRDRGKCHICGHFAAYSADHVIPDTEGGASTPDNLKAVHGHPKACPECSSAADRPVYCNEIRGAMSVDRARRLIEKRTGLKIAEGPQTAVSEPEGRDIWLLHQFC